MSTIYEAAGPTRYEKDEIRLMEQDDRWLGELDAKGY